MGAQTVSKSRNQDIADSNQFSEEAGTQHVIKDAWESGDLG